MAIVEGPDHTVTPPGRSALLAVIVLTAVSLGGAVISVNAGLNGSFLDAVGPEGHLSVPLPMTAFQLLTAIAAGSKRRPLALLGSGLLALAVTAAITSGFFDGGYADNRLNSAERGYQLLLVVALCLVALLASARFVRVWRAGVARRIV